jgi:hypothetical protein
VDPKAYLAALDTFKPGDVCIIFTPDDTHFDIALACIEAGMHVMVTKPLVKTLAEHLKARAAVCCLLFVGCCLCFVVCCLLFVVCCLLFIVYCLLFINKCIN